MKYTFPPIYLKDVKTIITLNQTKIGSGSDLVSGAIVASWAGVWGLQSNREANTDSAVY